MKRGIGLVLLSFSLASCSYHIQDTRTPNSIIITIHGDMYTNRHECEVLLFKEGARLGARGVHVTRAWKTFLGWGSNCEAELEVSPKG
jgi:hypothetical protein